MKIFSLFGEVFIEDEKAKKALDNTEKKAGKVGERLKSMIGTAAKVGAGIAAAGAAAGAGMLAMANKVAGTTDRIDKLSQKIGLSRQGFQEWEFVLSQSGASIETLQTGMKTFVEQIEQASRGTGEGARAFERLGISITDANGNLKDQETLFNETVVALQNMEDGAEKAALANQLLGRAGSELMPLLNGAAGSVDEMKQKARELGLVISDETVDAGVKFTDTMDQLKRSGGALFTQIGAGLIPIFQQLAEWIMAHMPQIQAVSKVVFDAIQTGVSYVVNWIGALISWLSEWRTNNDQTLTGIQEKFSAMVEAIVGFIQSFVDWAKEVWQAYGDDVLNILQVLWNEITLIFETAIAFVTEIFNAFAALFRGDWDALWASVKNILQITIDFVIGTIENAIDLILRLFGTDLATVKEKVSEVFNNVKDTIFSIWDKIVGKIEDAIANIRKAIDKVKDTFNKAKDFFSGGGFSGGIGGIGGGSGVGIPVPGYADGTDFHPGGPAIVGERGPELLELPRGSKVTPMEEVSLQQPITIQINNPTLFNDRDADRLGELIVGRLRTLGVKIE